MSEYRYSDWFKRLEKPPFKLVRKDGTELTEEEKKYLENLAQIIHDKLIKGDENE